MTVAGPLIGDDGGGGEAARCLTLSVQAGTAPDDAVEVKVRGTIDAPPQVPGRFIVADGVLPEVAPHDYWADWDSLLWAWDSSPL